MNIQNPIEILIDMDYDQSQGEFMTETLMLNYMKYLMNVADRLGMEVSVATRLTEQDEFLDRFVPLLQFKISDDGELLSEFNFEQYSIPLYSRFRAWILNDILYYMKSKALYKEFDEKHLIKINWKQKTIKI